MTALNASSAPSISMKRDYTDLGSLMLARVKSFNTRCLFLAGPDSARTKSPPQSAQAVWARSIERAIRGSIATLP